MTKATNYEISKKLAEIGFSRQAFWVWISKNCCAPYQTDYDGFRSYDLETLLDALPLTIEIENWGNWKYYNIYFKMNKNGFWYENLCNCDSSACPVEKYHYMEIIENESLADTAGRLIILLESKNLIKF